MRVEDGPTLAEMAVRFWRLSLRPGAVKPAASADASLNACLTSPLFSNVNGPIVTRRNAHLRHHRRAAKHPAHAHIARRITAARAGEATLTQWTTQRRTRARWFFSFLVFATFLFLASQSFAQAPAYKSEPLDPAFLQKSAFSQMDQAHKEGIGKVDLSEQWEKFPAFKAYYQKLIFGKMRDAAFVGELGSITHSLLEDIDRASRTRSPAAPLVRSYVIAMGKAVAMDNYHPAARINATLLLALVDDAPENPGEKRPPVPAAAALGTLVNLYRDAKNPDGVRAAALQGIARHVTLGAITNPAARAEITKDVMALANSQPPAGRSPAAHAFMQRYAVDILNVLAAPNASPETTKTLVSLSTASEKPTLIAAYAASKISTLQPGKQKLPNLPIVLKTWAARAANTIDGEVKRIAHLSPPTAVRDQPAMPTDDTRARTGYGEGSDYGADYGMDMDMGAYDTGMDMSMQDYDYDSMGMGMGPGMMMAAKPQPLEVITSRRRINHVLQQLQLGVTGQVAPGSPAKPAGLLGAAEAADQAAFDAWITTISGVVTAINVDTLDDRTKFVTELTAQAAVLKKLAGIEEVVADAAGGAAPALGDPALPGDPALLGGPPAAVAPAPAPAAVNPAAPGPPVGPAASPVPAPNAAGAAAPAPRAGAGPPAPAAPAAPQVPAAAPGPAVPAVAPGS